MPDSPLTLKEEIITVARILDGLDLVAAFGHVSARLPGKEEIWITPRRAPGLATGNELVRVDLDTGRVLENAGCEPLELALHLGVYRARSDVGAVCRTHPLTAGAFAVVGRPLAALHGFGAFLGPQVPVYPDPDLIVDDARARAVADVLGSAPAVLLRGNGALTVGNGLREACLRAIFLEESARLNVLASWLGEPAAFTGDEMTRRSRWFADETARAWEYYAARYASTTKENAH